MTGVSMNTQEITWELFERQVEACRLCPLYQDRGRTVI